MICKSCMKEKLSTDFHKSSRAKSGFQTYCKSCQLKMDKPELRKIRAMRYRNKWPAQSFWRHLSKRAKIKGVLCMSVADFADWYAETPELCAYCGASQEEAINLYKHRLHIERCNMVKNKYLTHEQMKRVASEFFLGINSHNELVKAIQWAIVELRNEAPKSLMIEELKKIIAKSEGR